MIRRLRVFAAFPLAICTDNRRHPRVVKDHLDAVYIRFNDGTFKFQTRAEYKLLRKNKSHSGICTEPWSSRENMLG